MKRVLVLVMAAACGTDGPVSSLAAGLADPAEVKRINVCFEGTLADGTPVPLGGVLYHVAPLHPATRAVLLVGGATGGSGPYDGTMAPLLARYGYVAVRYDKPGGGPRSPAPPGYGFTITRDQISDLHAQVARQLHSGRYTIGDGCPGATPARAGFAHIVYYGSSAGGAEGIEMIGRHPDLPVRALVVSASALDGVAATNVYLLAHANRQQLAGPVEYPFLAENRTDCERLFLDPTVAAGVKMNVCGVVNGVLRIPRAPLNAVRTGGAQSARNRTINARTVLELGVPVLRVYGDHDPFLPGGPDSVYFESTTDWFTPPPRTNVRQADEAAWARACRGETCAGCASLEPCDVSTISPLLPDTGHITGVHASATVQVEQLVAWMSARGLGPTPRD
jgi:pimeloyl-ACP methyl ester carboxylesterase